MEAQIQRAHPLVWTGWAFTVWKIYDDIKNISENGILGPKPVVSDPVADTAAVATNLPRDTPPPTLVVAFPMLFCFLWYVHSRYNRQKAPSRYSNRFGSWIARGMKFGLIERMSMFWQDMLVLCLAALVHQWICMWMCYRLVRFYENAVTEPTIAVQGLKTAVTEHTVPSGPTYNLHKYVVPRFPDSGYVDVASFLTYIIPRMRNKQFVASHLFEELASCNAKNPLLRHLQRSHEGNPMTTWTHLKQAVLLYKRSRKALTKTFNEALANAAPLFDVAASTLDYRRAVELLKFLKLTHEFSFIRADELFSNFFSSDRRKQLCDFFPSAFPDEDTQEYAVRVYKPNKKFRFKRPLSPTADIMGSDEASRNSYDEPHKMTEIVTLDGCKRYARLVSYCDYSLISEELVAQLQLPTAVSINRPTTTFSTLFDEHTLERRAALLRFRFPGDKSVHQELLHVVPKRGVFQFGSELIERLKPKTHGAE